MNPIADFVFQLVLHPITRYVVAWLVAIGTASYSLHEAWVNFNDANRPDGNAGHTSIDFGGQWTMGRMLVAGNARQLYNRNYQRVVVRAAYPRANEVPMEKRPKEEQGKHDAEELVRCFMGRDYPEVLASPATLLAASNGWELVALTACGSEPWAPDRLREAAKARGGPLYPPVNAFLYYPLALLPPQPAYRSIQVLNLVLAVVAALGVTVATRGGVWWPVAITGIILFPHFSGSINLGQNAALTVAILIWGWALIARGRPGAGGLVWGLLAFKPVWALAYLSVLLLTRRWGAAATMIATGAGIALATVPVVGTDVWIDWLNVGHEAAVLYNTDKNWIYLSRDVLSIPRRWLIDFHPKEGPIRDSLAATVAGWSILLTVFVGTLTLAVVRWRQAQATTGPVAAFLLLAGWLTCFHFMYYDTLLAALPVFLLLADARKYLEPIHIAILPVAREQLGEGLARYYDPDLPREYPWPPPRLRPGRSHLWVLNRMVPTLIVVLALTKYWLPWVGRRFFPGSGFGEFYGQPWDTFTLMALWLWCGWRWIREKPQPKEAGAPGMPMVAAPGADGLSGEAVVKPAPSAS